MLETLELTDTLEPDATIEEYDALEEGAPYELIGGKLVMTPSPTPEHQYLLTNLLLRLGNFVQQHRLGLLLPAPIDVRLTKKDVFQPDLIFIRRDRLSQVTKKSLNVVPDLVVEVLSPSTAYKDFTRKSEMYCAHGVEEYWIIDPGAQTIEVRIKRGDLYQIEAFLHTSDTLQSAMFPGFAMKVEDIFVSELFA
jgi:Uma2 family endonuclease